MRGGVGEAPTKTLNAIRNPVDEWPALRNFLSVAPISIVTSHQVTPTVRWALPRAPGTAPSFEPVPRFANDLAMSATVAAVRRVASARPARRAPLASRGRAVHVIASASAPRDQPPTNASTPAWRRAVASVAAGAYLAAASATLPPPAAAEYFDEGGQEPSVMGLKLKPREQEVILETKAEHINEDFSHMDLVGAIYTEGDLRGSDFSGSDLRAAIFSRAVMPGVNFEGSDMQNAFLDYVVLRGSNFRGVIAAGANFVRSDLGECDVTDADFTEAVIDRYQAIQLCETASGTNKFTGVDTRDSLGCDVLKRYEGAGAGGKVAVSKGSGIWGGAAKE